MSIDDLVPPEGDSVIINRNGVVIASVETLLKWTDNWIQTAEFRLMLSKGSKPKKRRKE